MQQVIVERRATIPFLQVLALKDFGLMWLAQIVSSMGDQFTYVAMALLVYQTTGSALQVGVMLAITTIPNILLGLIAGVFVDRWDRRRTMIVCDVTRAIVIGSIPWLIHLHLWMAYLAIFVSTAANRFLGSARVASIPHVVPKEILVSANAIDHTGVQCGATAGYAFAGIVVGLYGATVAFLFDASTFLFSALMLSLIVIPYVPKPQGSTKDAAQIKNDLLDGLRYIYHNNALRAAMGFAIWGPVGSGLLNALLVVFALRVLKTDDAGYGLIEAGCAIGIIVSGLVIGQIGNHLKRGMMMTYGCIGIGAGAVLLSFSPSLGIAMLAMTFLGIMNGVLLVGIRTLLQENTQSEYRGRVSGAWNTAIASGGIVGMSLAGLADIFPVQAMLIMAGLVQIVAGVALARLSSLRNA